MNNQVLSNPIDVYVVYAGQQPFNTSSTIETFISKIGGSDHWAVTGLYYYFLPNGTRQSVSQVVTLTNTTTYPMAINATVYPDQIVKYVLGNGTFPTSASAMYIVLTSPDISTVIGEGQNFQCRYGCAYHSTFSQTGTNVTYIWVGDESKLCPGICRPNVVDSCGKNYYNHTRLAVGC